MTTIVVQVHQSDADRMINVINQSGIATTINATDLDMVDAAEAIYREDLPHHVDPETDLIDWADLAFEMRVDFTQRFVYEASHMPDLYSRPQLIPPSSDDITPFIKAPPLHVSLTPLVIP